MERATRILKAVRKALDALHDLGISFGDLSVGNIIVDDHDNPRLIDFESCSTLDDTSLGLRTPDFCLLNQIEENISAKDRDIYACSCIAIALVLRLTTLGEISGHVLKCVSSDLANSTSQVPVWWFDACGHLETTARRFSSCRVPAFVPPSIETKDSRADLRRALSTAALNCFMPNHEQLFPTSSAARAGAFLGFSSGCGGLLRALRLNGLALEPSLIQAFSDGVAAAIERQSLPLNYDFGIAGLFDCCQHLGLDGLSNIACEKLRDGWGSVTDPSLGAGLTGIALALRRGGKETLADEVMAAAIKVARAHNWRKNGLQYGRAGVIAGSCQFGALLRSSSDLRLIIRNLIFEELAQTVRHPEGFSLSLRGESDRYRLLPYLSDGTAGLFLALQFAHASDCIDFQLDIDTALALSADLGTPFMLEGSLMDGAAGLAVVLTISRRMFAEVAQRIPEPGWGRIRKYLLPLRSGVGVLHPGTLRFDLSHSQGSAGILEAMLWLDGLAELNLSGLYIPAVTAEGSAPMALVQASN